ncbi:MAG: RHS repeat-associated core domain-containing protein [Candidatus Brocadiia bacterium]
MGRPVSLGRLRTVTLSSTYDALGRRTVVTAGSYDLVTDTWKGQLLEKREYHSGAYLTHLNDSGANLSGYGYDTFGRIKNHRWKDSSGTLLAGWSHDYDRVGNKKYQEALHDATESELYDYDGVYRLTSFERGQLNANKDDIASPTRSQTWTLDPLGNWDQTVLDSVTETRTHNDVNELTQRTVGQNPAIDLTYDDAGNLTQDGDDDGDHKYVWDYRNRLIEVQEKQSGTWTTIAEYTYDAKNRRVVKEVTNKGDLNGTTRFVWGGQGDWQCLEERDSSGDLVARFTSSPGYIDSPARQERDLNGDDDFSDTNEVVWYHSNTLYSVYAVSDSSQSVTERYRYDAYGAATVLDPDGSADSDGLSDVENPYAFTARRLDLESDLMYYRNRQYSVALGRFISRDPAGYVDGHALYVYAADQPTGWIDAGGQDAYLAVRDSQVSGPFGKLTTHCSIVIAWLDTECELDQNGRAKLWMVAFYCEHEVGPGGGPTISGVLWGKPSQRSAPPEPSPRPEPPDNRRPKAEVKHRCVKFMWVPDPPHESKEPEVFHQAIAPPGNMVTESAAHEAVVSTPLGKYNWCFNNCCSWAKRAAEKGGLDTSVLNWGMNGLCDP